MMKIKPPPSKHKTVMLVDDSEIDNYINELIMKGTGFAENILKYSGAVSSLDFFKNLEILSSVSPELVPSYLFLDINMPVLDGFQFLDEFSNFSAKLKKEIKIVILSTSSNSIDIKKSRNYSQVVKFLQKPLRKEDLNKLS